MARARIVVESRVIAHDALVAIDGRHQLSGIAPPLGNQKPISE